LPLQIQGDRDNPGRHQTSVTFRVVDPKDPSLIDQAMAKLRTRNMTGIVHWLSPQLSGSLDNWADAGGSCLSSHSAAPGRIGDNDD
jgi:hypothetical protein